MLQVRFHANSTQQVRWPTNVAEIIALGEAVFAAEEALPAEQRYPQLALLQPRLGVLISFATTASLAEAERTVQSDVEKTAFKAARILVRFMTHALTLKYRNVALLEAWGVEVVGSGPRARVRIPSARSAVLKMLNWYIVKENSLPADQRITSPALTEVTAARDALVTAHLQRVEATSARELAIRQRNDASHALLRALQLIAMHHVTLDFGGVVDQNLQMLGYDLVTRPNSRPPEGEEVPASPPAESPS